MFKTFFLGYECPYYLTSCAERGNDEPVKKTVNTVWTR